MEEQLKDAVCFGNAALIKELLDKGKPLALLLPRYPNLP